MALVVKEPPANAADVRDMGSVPGLGQSPGGGHGNPLQILAWRIPWTEEPGWGTRVHGVIQSWTGLERLNTHALRPLFGRPEHVKEEGKMSSLNPGNER